MNIFFATRADPVQHRFANDADSDAIIKLITNVLREYGDDVCVANAERDLAAIEATYFEKHGAFWVLESNSGEIVGTHAAIAIPESEGVCTFKRLYLEKSMRGGNEGSELMQVTLDWAKKKGFRRVEFWSDTRFHRAHTFFKKFGFSTDGTTRQMSDSHDPYEEYWFWLDLNLAEQPSGD